MRKWISAPEGGIKGEMGSKNFISFAPHWSGPAWRQAQDSEFHHAICQI